MTLPRAWTKNQSSADKLKLFVLGVVGKRSHGFTRCRSGVVRRRMRREVKREKASRSNPDPPSRAESDLLMFCASFLRVPTAMVFLSRSEPARSIKWKRDTRDLRTCHHAPHKSVESDATLDQRLVQTGPFLGYCSVQSDAFCRAHLAVVLLDLEAHGEDAVRTLRHRHCVDDQKAGPSVRGAQLRLRPLCANGPRLRVERPEARRRRRRVEV